MPLVQDPDKDDWKKLWRLLQYIKGKIRLPLILRANTMNVVKWWVDAAFALHHNMKSHIKVTISLGRGSVLSMLKKQKLNTKISTETKLVGANDSVPQMLWTKYFLEAQGYGIDENIMYQDNLSVMLLEKNGKKSSTKNTKHINARVLN